MSEAGNVWPEQEAVNKWWEKHNIELKEMVSEYRIKREEELRERIQQSETQLGGVLATAEGWYKDGGDLEPGDYGWSVTFSAVLKLRRALDALQDEDRLREFAEKCRLYPKEPVKNLLHMVFPEVLAIHKEV